MSRGCGLVYLRWGIRRDRGTAMAAELGGRLIEIDDGAGRGRQRLLALRTAAWTLNQLARARPATIICSFAHPWAFRVAMLYRPLTGCRLVADCHNVAFEKPGVNQRRHLSGTRRLLQRADLVLVHNRGVEALARQLLGDAVPILVVRSPIPDYAAVAPAALPQPTVMAICSQSPFEPIDALLAAAGRMADVNFIVTGLPGRIRTRRLPPNASMGHLCDERFDAVLCGADAAVALDVRPTVLQFACHQALGAATPLVCSDNAVSRDYLADAAVYVAPRPDAIVAGIREALARRAPLAAAARRLAPLRRREREAQLAQLCESLQ